MAKKFCSIGNKGAPLIRKRLIKTWQTSLSRIEKLSKKQTGRKMNDSYQSSQLTAYEKMALEKMAEELMNSPTLSPLVGRLMIKLLPPVIVRLRTDNERN